MTYINEKYNDSVLLLPFRGTGVAGTWQWNNVPGQSYSGYLYNNSNIINNEYEFTHIKLKRGSYKITVCGIKNLNRGIVTISYNGNVILTDDLYNAGALNNYLVSDTFTVTSDTDATLDFKVLSKNASSSGYVINFTYIKIEKTS